jgi:sialidase-1
MKQFFIVSILIISSIAAHAQINSSDYHTLRNKLGNSLLKFSKNKKATVAFLGGSITYNPGWRDSTCSYLKRKFPLTEFEFIAAGIPSMGSTPGAFRLERDILSKGEIDLLFVEAAVNDPTNGRSNKEQIRGMEGIIRHARTTNSKMDIITMYFVDPDKMARYKQGLVPEVIVNHEKVADYYDVSSINLAKEVTDRITAGEFTWEDDFKDLHPAPFGQIVYYNSISTFLENSFDSASESNLKTIKYPLPKKLDEFCYDQGKIISIEKAIVKSDWKIEPNWKPSKGEHTRAGYVNVPMLCADEPGAECSFSFKGKAIGIAVAAGPDAGIIAYQIDGGAWISQDLFTKWSSQLHLPWYYVLNAELSDKKHTLSIRLTENRNSESTGTACRIKHFFINE